MKEHVKVVSGKFLIFIYVFKKKQLYYLKNDDMIFLFRLYTIKISIYERNKRNERTISNKIR